MNTAFALAPSGFLGQAKATNTLRTVAPAKPAATTGVTMQYSKLAAGKKFNYLALSQRKVPYSLRNMGGAYPLLGYVKKAKANKKIVGNYMAQCVMAQTKMISKGATNNGVYGVQCTEGGYKYSAWEARADAVYRRFRNENHKPVTQQVREFYATRRHALQAVNMCHSEEMKVIAYPKAAAALVMGYMEASRSCNRYAQPESTAEWYMSKSVERQMVARSAPGGVYSHTGSCVDGAAKGEAYSKSIRNKYAYFRDRAVSPATYYGQKYEQAKYGRKYFAHGCHHEETQFGQYPAAAAAMRPTTYNY